MNNHLADKNVFITGAGANIGRAIALEMAQQGANIYFAEKDAARSAALEQELRTSGTKVEGFVCDVSKPAAIEHILRTLRQQEVAIDVLVNNVGITTKAHDTTPQSFAHWQNVMDTNVLGPLYLSRLFAQDMIEQRIAGNIIFITSIHQWVYFGGEVYSATKASLGMIIEEMAVSLAEHGIRVNGIAPGDCREQPNGQSLPNSGTPLYHEAIQPRYIGRAAVFLASDYFSHYTTGTILKVDGGLSLYAFHNRNLISPPVASSFPRLRKWVRRGRSFWSKIRRLIR